MIGEEKSIYKVDRIGFGGSCHWCTEAIFLSLSGVLKVDQGWIAPYGDPAAFSEAVIVEFDADTISLEDLVAVHLHSHSCTSEHNMRSKYRSAIYPLEDHQEPGARSAIAENQKDFTERIITEVLSFGSFKINADSYLNYYFKDPEKPFCQNVVNPKLRELIDRFNHLVDQKKLAHLLGK